MCLLQGHRFGGVRLVVSNRRGRLLSSSNPAVNSLRRSEEYPRRLDSRLPRRELRVLSETGAGCASSSRRPAGWVHGNRVVLVC